MMERKHPWHTCLLFLLLNTWFALPAQEEPLSPQDSLQRIIAEIPAPDVADFKLANGLRVMVLEDQEQENISVRLLVDRPLVAEKTYAGTGYLTEQMLLAGTTTQNKKELTRSLAKLRGDVTISDRTITGHAPHQRAAELLAYIADLVINPVFQEEEFTELKENYRNSTLAQKEEASFIAEQFSRQLIFGTHHPYGEKTTAQTIDQVTVQACRNFHKRYYRPTIAHLAIVGNITPEEARELAEASFGQWQSVGPLFSEFFNPAPLPESTKVNIVDVPAPAQAILEIGYSFRLRPGGEEALKAQLLNVILQDRLATKSWYHPSLEAALIADPHLGRLRINTELPAAEVSTAVQDIFAIMYQLREEPLAAEALVSAKHQLATQLAIQAKNPEKLVGEAIDMLRFGLPATYLQDRLKTLEGITAEELLATAQRYLLPGRSQVIVVGDKAIAPALESLTPAGKIHFYTPDGEEVQSMNWEIKMEGVTAQSVIDQYVRAIGGAERLADVRDYTMVIEAEFQAQTMTATQVKKEGQKLLKVVKIGEMLASKLLFNGSLAVGYRGNTKEEIDAATLVAIREEATIFPETRYAALGYQLELAGAAVLNNRNVYIVEIESPSGESSTDYFDMRTGLRVRTVVIEGGAPAVTDMMDYRPIAGIKFPHQLILSGVSVEPIPFTVKSITINQDVADELFEERN